MKNLARVTASSAAIAAVAMFLLPQQAFAAAHEKEAMMTSEATALNQALAGEYAEMAAEEEVEKDIPDVKHFQAKAQAAADGFVVKPDMPNSRTIPGTETAYAERTYQRILAAYDDGAATGTPRLLAQAQSGYDCWLQEVEEGYQLLHIWRCRDKANAALDAIENPPVAEAPAPEAAPARTYTVYFEFDQAEIASEAFNVIDQAMEDFRGRPNADIDVTGHADTAGPADYNVALSNRRADAVADVLELRGVAADRIEAAALGESVPAVQTGDGVRERLNRRVVIIVQDRQ